MVSGQDGREWGTTARTLQSSFFLPEGSSEWVGVVQRAICLHPAAWKKALTPLRVAQPSTPWT